MHAPPPNTSVTTTTTNGTASQAFPPSIPIHFVPLNKPVPAPNVYNPGVVAQPPVNNYPAYAGIPAGNTLQGPIQPQVQNNGAIYMRAIDGSTDDELREVIMGYYSDGPYILSPLEPDSTYTGRPHDLYLVTGLNPAVTQCILYRDVIRATHGSFLPLLFVPNPTTLSSQRSLDSPIAKIST
ncbi:hypothetical protein D9758_014947 [Tetrapyrgos nigripes]|uniref:Uncharacterized protein n=1 Tax=Tetrapyrgos nigripes TaxID=182062 RepID=A0A8H5CJH7_9AGAR|nr:hypothetical protein D9758_014947 [Tetrapyrgos nigripes]